MFIINVRGRSVVCDSFELIDGGTEVTFNGYWLDTGDDIPDGLYYAIQERYRLDLDQLAREA